eukprot:181673_1
MLSFAKFGVFLLLVGYYLVALHFITEYVPGLPGGRRKKSPDMDPFGLYIPNVKDHNDSRWISFGYYAAIPFFYTKSGIVETQKLITITSICDIELLYEARHIASNYRAGPLSFAIYIDKDYKKINTTKLRHVIQSYFIDILSLYDITIGIVAINTSSAFYLNTYKQRKFDATTSLMFTIPTNVMRNLAEHQVQTDWIFNIDIDFWYLSETLNNNQNIKSLIEGMNSMIKGTKYGMKTVFVVPAFEILNETEDLLHYAMMSKSQLTDSVYLENIAPFHEGMQAQKCSEYGLWYKATRPYVLNFDEIYCHWAYEPWFIIHKNISTSPLYRWDDRYLGRGLNKVERVYKLRHGCFNFVVMHNLFMIHAPDSIVIHHERVSNEEKKKWHKYNLELFRTTVREYREDPYSCAQVDI